MCSVLTLVDGRLVLCMALDVFREPFIKLLVRVKQRRHDEMEQGPQLRQEIITVSISTKQTERNAKTETERQRERAL